MEQDDPTNLPLGVSPFNRNVRFHLTGCRTRDGLQSRYGFVLPDGGAVTGLAAQKIGQAGLADFQAPIAFSSLGNMYVESPAGTTRTQPISEGNLPQALPTGASMQAALAFKRAYCAFSDLRNSKGAPAVFNPLLGTLDPFIRPFGAPWTANTPVRVGDTVCPTAVGGNGHIYRCTTAGVTGAAEPIWNVAGGSATNDGATVVWTETTPVMTSAAGAGNICTGLRYMGVLFVNRNGAVSGFSSQSVISANLNTANKQLTISPVPTGPPETIARILVFTPGGQLSQLAGTGVSNAGPFFFILPNMPIGVFDFTQAPAGVSVADIVNGVSENSTVINDNVTTTATINFDDNYLKSTLNEVSAYLRKIQVPVCSDAYYSKTLRRMFFAADTLPSGWYVSNQGAAEEIYGDTGIVQCAENNGENRTAVREWDSIVYLMKEKSGHVLTPSADDPSKWDVKEQWSGSGPCGPRAVDTCTTFMCYVHRSGVWIYKGGKPFLITKELPADVGTTWKSINWLYQHLISVMIDDETRQIFIQVPTGQSTVPNLELVCNYEESPDFAPPIHFSPYIGKEIATGSCYKWSVSDKQANLVIRAERTIINPPAGFDSATIKSQLLYASANPDGAVSAVVPLQFDDNGVGIDSVYETAAPQNLMRPCQLGGVQANIGGQGSGSVYVLALRTKDPKQGGVPVPKGKPEANAGFELKLKKRWYAGIPYSCGASGQNERFRLRFTNDKAPGNGFDLKWAAIYARPVAQARAG